MYEIHIMWFFLKISILDRQKIQSNPDFVSGESKPEEEVGELSH